MTEDTTAAPAPSYSVGDAVGYGWRKFEQHWQKIVGYGLVIGIPLAILYGAFLGLTVFGGSSTTSTDAYGNTMTTRTVSGGTLGLGLLLELAFTVAAVVISVGIVRATVRVLNGEDFSLGDILSFNRLGSALGAQILVVLGTIVGLVLCIIPGVIFAFLANYTVWFVIDRGQSPVEAIKSSIAMVRANLGPALLFFFVTILLGLAGELACVVGLLVAIPVIQLATGYSYRRFSGGAQPL